MSNVNISTFRSRLSYYLKQARAGKEITIVDRDEPVARLVRVPKTDKSQDAEARRIAALAERGILRLPTDNTPLPDDFFENMPKSNASVVEALLKEREENRF